MLPTWLVKLIAAALAVTLLALSAACAPAATPTPTATPTMMPTPTAAPTPVPTATPTTWVLPPGFPTPTPRDNSASQPPRGAQVVLVGQQIEHDGITVGLKEMWLTDKEIILRFWHDCTPFRHLETMGTADLWVDGANLHGSGGGGPGCDASYLREFRFPALPRGAREITFRYGPFLGPDIRDLTLELPIGQYLSKLSPKYGGEVEMDLVVQSDGLAYKFTKLSADPDSVTLRYEPANDPARWQPLSGPPGVETALQDDKGNKFTISGSGSGWDGKNDYALKDATLSFKGYVDMGATLWKLTASKLGKLYRGPWEFQVDVSAYTGGLPFATPTPTPVGVAAPTPTPITLVKPFRWPSRLKDALAMTPAEFADRPLEFADYLGARKAMGLEEYRGVEAMRQNNRPFLEGPLGVLPGHDEFAFYSMMLYEKAGLDLFGFNLGIWCDDTAKGYQSPTFLAAEGVLGKQTLWAKLAALGYKEAEYEGVRYLWFNETPQGSLSHPLNIVGAYLDRVAVPDDALLIAPNQGILQSLVNIRQGNARSLAGSRLHTALADAVGNGLLGAAIMPSDWLVERIVQQRVWSQGSGPPLYRYLEGPDKWGKLSPYSLALIGYRYAGEAEEVVVALAYPDPGMAEKDAQELKRRWNSFYSMGTPVKDSCSPFSTSVVSGPDFSVLLGSCPAKRDEAKPVSTGPGVWLEILRMGDLHLLAPDIEVLDTAVRER
ncbi:MAG: hypothetical protein Q8P22_08345 [Chloroflexota bacterium]|nr:hypothetical protein [Chloroflexota bacterium]